MFQALLRDLKELILEPFAFRHVLPRQRMPPNSPFSLTSGVLNHSQMMIRPSLVTFSLTEWAVISPNRIRRNDLVGLVPGRRRNEFLEEVDAQNLIFAVSKNPLGCRIPVDDSIADIEQNVGQRHSLDLQLEALKSTAPCFLRLIAHDADGNVVGDGSHGIDRRVASGSSVKTSP